MRKLLIAAGVLLILVIGLAIFHAARMARRDAARMNAIGRLTYLHLALLNHEHRHARLPPRHFSDSDGNPTHSWVAAILREVGEARVANQLDLSQPWSAPTNQSAIQHAGRFAEWFGSDGFFPCAFASDRSIWEQENGWPRGTFAELPHSIVLVAIPRRGLHPLQPFVVDEPSLRQFLIDGKEVLYVTCGREFGNVRLQEDNLVYAPQRVK